MRGARRIQRVARAWLAARAAVRAREETEREAARVAESRRYAAAVALQSRVRGTAGRRVAAAARVQRTARGIAATKIQRARRRCNARASECLAAAAAATAAKAVTARWVASRASCVAACAAAEAALIINDHSLSLDTVGDEAFSLEDDSQLSGSRPISGDLGRGDLSRWRAARRIQMAYRAHAACVLCRTRRAAVQILQRYGRGWLVRRQGWWADASAEMASTRARRRRWREHRGEVMAAAPAERALLHTAVYAGAELSDVGARLEKERNRFARAWALHEASTRRRAVAGPLPKNWVPQSDPVTGEILNLRL